MATLAVLAWSRGLEYAVAAHHWPPDEAFALFKVEEVAQHP